MPTFLNSGKLIRLRMFENIARVLLFVLLAIATYAGQSASSVSPLPGGDDVITDQNKEMSQFFKAKEELFKQDWAGAKVGLEQYLEDYPSGRLVDEALYWIAQCSNRLSKAETDSGRMIALREEAVQSLTRLVGDFPKSFWLNDALTLRTEICRDLDHFGFSQYRAYLDSDQEKERESYRHISVHNSFREVNREAARPILYNLAKTDPSPQVRITAIFLLGQYERDSAIPFLQSLALTDPEESVRKEANEIVRRIRMNQIPVRLNVYCFTSYLDSLSNGAFFPENAINLFSLSHNAPGTEMAEENIERFADGKIGELKSYNANRYVNDMALEYFGRFSEFSHGFGENKFFFNFVNPDLIKEQTRIKGTLRVDDQLTKTKLERPFIVDAQHDVLAVLRHDKKLSMLLFQFENSPETRLTSAEISKESTTPIHKTTFQNLLDCAVISSAIVQKTRANRADDDTLDLGPARAEIPGAGGKWVLEGMLLCDRKARQFIGRQFTLTDPKGKVIARGAYIEVPADNPQAYKVK